MTTPTTDRELLEMAAKAGGYSLSAVSDMIWSDAAAEYIPWNPLTDDGDALRLAVKLGLMIDIQNKVNATSVWTTDESGSADFDAAHGKDPYAATRRAIVRAAAEIGKAMP